MRRWTAPLALLSLLVPLAAARAVTPTDSADAPHIRGYFDDLPVNRLTLDYFFDDVTAGQPGTGGNFSPIQGTVIGPAFELDHRFCPDCGWFGYVGGGYGIGGSKFEYSSFTSKSSFHSTYGELGIGYELPLGRRAWADCQGAFYYANSWASFENPTATEDGPRFSLYGLDKSIGGGVKLNDRLGLKGEWFTVGGFSSAKTSTVKYSATEKLSCYRGGLSFGF